MTNSLPTQPTKFTPEQSQILGQVYNLILSWRKEKKKLEAPSSKTAEPHVGETVKLDSTKGRGSND